MWQSVKQFFKTSTRRLDPVLFTCSSILTVMSLLTIWGAKDNFGTSKFVMQVAMTMLGILCMLFIVKLDYRELVDKFWLIFIIGSAALLSITLLFGISGINNDTANRSWLTIIKIGERAFMIQPSEFVKVAFIISFSKHLSLVKDTINHPKTLVTLAVHAGLIVGLILLSGDLGVALVYLGIIAIMLAFAGLSIWYFAGTFAALFIAPETGGGDFVFAPPGVDIDCDTCGAKRVEKCKRRLLQFFFIQTRLSAAHRGSFRTLH